MQYRCQWKKVLLTLSWFPFSQHSCIHPAKVSFSVCFIVAKTHNMRSILLTKLCLKYSIVNYKHNDGAKVRFLNWPLYSIACDKIHLLWKKLPFLLSQKSVLNLKRLLLFLIKLRYLVFNFSSIVFNRYLLRVYLVSEMWQHSSQTELKPFFS